MNPKGSFTHVEFYTTLIKNLKLPTKTSKIAHSCEGEYQFLPQILAKRPPMVDLKPVYEFLCGELPL